MAAVKTSRDHEVPVEEVPEARYLIGQTALQMAVNVLITRPYGEVVPNAEGVVVGDLINALRNLSPASLPE
jgi:hypothetical protein